MCSCRKGFCHRCLKLIFKRYMLRFASYAVCMLLCLCARAELRIVSLNTPTIEVGGRSLRVNDTFNRGESIRWKAPLHAMKVVDTATGETHVLVAEDEGKAADRTGGLTSLGKSMTASISATTPIRRLRDKLSAHFYILGSMDVASGMSTDADHYFFISYIYRDHEYTKAVTNKNGTFTLTDDIFKVNGITPAGELSVKVYYYNKVANRVVPVCDKMRVTVLPQRLRTAP